MKKIIKKTLPKRKPSAKKAAKKSNYTHIIAVLDRSGSMSSVQTDAIGGFNTFLETQKNLKTKSNYERRII